MPREFSYRDLSQTLKRHKFLVPGFIFGFVVLAFVWLNIATPKYTAIMVVDPTTKGTLVNTTDIAQKPQTKLEEEESGTDFARFIQILTSPEVAATLLKDPSLDIKQQLMTRSGMTQSIKALLWHLAGQQAETPQDAATLADILSHELRVDDIGRSTMRQISMRHANRDFVIQFLNKLYSVADTQLRQQTSNRNLQETAYLRAALARVTITEQRKALTDLLTLREQTQILLSADVPFAAEQIQQAQAPATPDWPPVGLVLFFAVCLGAFTGLSVLYLLAIRTWLNQSR